MQHLEQLRKAAKWLNKKTDDGHYIPVALVRRGYAEFVAYIYKIERPDRPSVWYCMEMAERWVPKSIKRICLY